MRVIIAGSRDFSMLDYAMIEDTCWASGYAFTAVISGGASGVDTLGEIFAKKHGIPVERYPADWDRYGKRAGHVRNEYMATRTKAEALVAVWDGKSRGTKDMVSLARTHRLLVHLKIAAPTTIPVP